MREVLIMRLAGPLASFGGPAVDARRPTDRLPGRSFLAGLLGNALGLERSEGARLATLQGALVYAARADVAGHLMRDYQTADLGSAKMARGGWTTRGEIEWRAKSKANLGTHQREVMYLSDVVITVALSIAPGADAPTVRDLARALRTPARPLYLGRACCPPAAPIGQAIVAARSVLAALAEWPIAPSDMRRGGHEPGRHGRVALDACWPRGDSDPRAQGAAKPCNETRDFALGVHTGVTLRCEGTIQILPNKAGEETAA